MNVKDLRAVHFVGIGGINMSAVAKLLLAAGVRVSGSDVHSNAETEILAARGANISVGHAAGNLPQDAECLVYSSAVPSSNPEREEARRRGIPEMTNFAFLSSWFADAFTMLVTGTHGKSTTTALLGLMLSDTTVDPTVIVGSKVPAFADGNIRIGRSDQLLIEGDEYAKHFLEFRPNVVLVNNIEHDHPDIFPTKEDVIRAFAQLIEQIQIGGLCLVNGDDDGARRLLEVARSTFQERNITVVTFGMREDADVRLTVQSESGHPAVVLHAKPPHADMWTLTVPSLIGAHNLMNIAGAMSVVMTLGVDREKAAIAGGTFTGIWRRFELLGEKAGVRYYSDYGHHPTAVAATLRAAREAFPSSRLVLCFQPHHRNRTKQLFLDFVPSFDLADVLILCEIYDVAGREAQSDAEISSQDLVDAIIRHDADRGVHRLVEYAANPAAAVARTQNVSQSGDIVIVMGAGDIDDAMRQTW